ncbi:hypothetical protein PDE_09662 [Penicillium oxalicum 114-2]|uniref:5'-3' DNA helicase ZGRF1-like N-terminal domain-containing protein n=1 Tax=Penicillium oxalicum (strain 114-2 / CGMCC 5302) TaxID=933388 RepID=S8B701_PENO1|nr:hypothetical protein PDE_09662 [Penicillium oxalicum 114-2]
MIRPEWCLPGRRIPDAGGLSLEDLARATLVPNRIRYILHPPDDKGWLPRREGHQVTELSITTILPDAEGTRLLVENSTDQRTFFVSLSLFWQPNLLWLAWTAPTLKNVQPLARYTRRLAMSTPVSLTPRGTAPTSSASAVPLTASVIKFRCLYTHDLRRKTKRWQDGYLRYHAFNKRVMVYDESGNYIGDHHWRNNEEVQDGDELELDKGALIQVGERMETTQTDLTNLLDKRKSSQGSPQAKGSVSQTPQVSAPIRSSGSSQPFRSLNELLGIKKTPIGHLVSPFEERHSPKSAANNSQSEARAPKRQKVNLAGTPVRSKQPIQSQVVDLTGREDELIAPNVQGVPRRQNFSSEASHAREQRLDNLGREQHGPPAGIPPKPLVASTNHSLSPRLNGNKDPDLPNMRKGPLPKPRPAGGLREISGDIHDHSKPTSNRAPTPRSQKEPPRKAAPTVNTTCPGSHRVPPDLPPQKPSLDKSTRDGSVAFKKPALPVSSGLGQAAAQPVRTTSSKENQPSQSGSASLAITPAEKPIHTNPPATMLRLASGKPRRKLMYSALLPGASSQDSSAERSASSSASFYSSNPSRREPAIKSMESQDIPASRHELAASTADFLPSTSTQFILEEMVAPAAGPSSIRLKEDSQSTPPISNLPPKAPVRRALDAPFRKSISDPGALITGQSRSVLTRSALSAIPEHHEPVEEGPWTSEALYLFDFWPPGRPKP